MAAVRQLKQETSMFSTRAFMMLILFMVMLSVGCSRSNDEEIAKARAEAVAARAEAEAAKAGLPKLPKAPTGPRVWRDTEAEEFCKWLGIEGECFRYEGGWIAFWLEESDSDGKPTKWGEELIDFSLEEDDKGARVFPQGMVSGSAAWVRRSQNKYDWDLAFKSQVQTDGGAMRKGLIDQLPKDTKIDKIKSKGVTTSNAKCTPEPPDGKRPTTPGGIPRLTYGDADVTLKEGQEVTLVTLQTVGENGEVVRTAKLQCKVLK